MTKTDADNKGLTMLDKIERVMFWAAIAASLVVLYMDIFVWRP